MEELIIINKNGEKIILGNQGPFFLEKIDGIGEVPVTLENQKAPKQDGSTYLGNVLDNRAISIEGTIITKGDPNALEEARRKMQRVLNPKLGEVMIAYKDKEIRGIAETTPVFPGGSGSKGLYYQKYLIHLICHEPFWLDAYFESREMSYLMGGLSFPLLLPSGFSERSFRRIFENKGDVATPVKIEFKGPAINPTIKNYSTGQFITVQRNLEENETLYIDTEFGNKRVEIETDGNRENAFNWIDLGSEFFQLRVGDNLLEYNSNNDSEKTRVVVRYKNRYVGV